MRCETYIFLNNLINAPVITQQGDLLIKKARFETELWLEGKSTGNLTAELIIKHSTYLRQKIVGVLTEGGARKSAPIIVGIYPNAKIKELSDKLDIFKEIMYNRDTTNEQKHLDTYNYQLQQIAKSILEILRIIDKTSTNSFEYKNEEEMLQAQELFIQIAGYLIVAADKFDSSLQHDYYECLKVLLKRGELDLFTLNFDDTPAKRNIQLKYNVALQYQNLLYTLLDTIFDYLDAQGLHEVHKNFIEFYISYAYFRIPEFRAQLLIVLSVEKSMIYTDTGKTIEIDSVLIDWDKDFYAHIKDQPRYVENKHILAKSLNKNWRIKFRQQSPLFFYFVSEWCEYVRSALVGKNISWENIVGYDTIIDNFIERMSSVEVVAYPDRLISASLSLLHNPNVLDLMVKTLIMNTK